MDELTKQTYQKYLRKHQARIDLPGLCFGPQLSFLNDDSQFAIAVTSRRAGKTTACAIDLLQTAHQTPKCVSLYITLARTNAKKIIWPMLLDLNRELKLGGEANQADLSLTLPNRSVIYCSGASTAGEIDRFRGLALKLAYIDESQSFGLYLQRLIEDVLVPACFDNRGKIKMIGTPPRVPVGIFYDAWRGAGWSKHHWNMFQNPWILKKSGQTPNEILNSECKRRGVTIDDPTIQREMFGNFVVDTKGLVVQWSEANDYSEIPKGKTHHIIGVDIGFHDADAIAVLGYGDSSPNTYLVEESIRTKQGITDLARDIEHLQKKYDAHKIVMDTGGLGKKIAEEIIRRYAIPVVAADKTRKFENIEVLNDALRTNRLFAKKDSRFVNDSLFLEWDTDKMRPDKKVVSDRFHSDIIDAVLYAFKESPAYSWTAPVARPLRGTSEWFKNEVDEMERYAIEKAEHDHEREPDGTEYL